MTAICGLCNGEMGDIDFHLEGKCQRKGSEDYGTERCAHGCHTKPDAQCDGLRLLYKHPEHCCACDGSKFITMEEAKARGLPLDIPEAPSSIGNTAKDATDYSNSIFSVKRWSCRRNHNYTGAEVNMSVVEHNDKRATSAALCPRCIINFLNREFPAFEVKKDG